MYDGVPDQFHQFITPRTSSSSLPLHLPFPLSTPNNTFPPFDPYNQQNHPSQHHQLPLHVQPNLLHPLHPHKDDEDKEQNSTTPSMNNFQIERDQRQILPQLIDPWTNDEVLALLKIRSSMESWFPDFTWEHVSRKLADVGYKRSAEKCKEKFEEESRFFNNINNNHNQNSFGKNFRFVTELEEVYQGGGGENNKNLVEAEKANEVQDKMDPHVEEDSRMDDVLVSKKSEEEVVEKGTTNDEKKRKRSGDDRFEVFKGFCESVVKKMMDQQEEMHNKLIEDMIKRDEEKFSREEAWKKQEMEKMNKELELMAHEQAIAGDRQSRIIQFLNKFSTSANSSSLASMSSSLQAYLATLTSNSSSTLHSQNPNPETLEKTLQPIPVNPSSTLPSSSTTLVAQPRKNNPISSYSLISSSERDDIGRRWPKDEVLALINLRCNNNNEEKEGNSNNKAPLWERISQGMLELGYKRSAKRCKEKWENINKYFRKTKDANRKRSLDSRTCPYFHLLSNLYNQGKLVLQSDQKQESNNVNVAEENVVQEKATQDENQDGAGAGESSQVGPPSW